jgi:hypothetical protein
LSRRAALLTQRILYGDLSIPLQGPRVVKAMCVVQLPAAKSRREIA